VYQQQDLSFYMSLAKSRDESEIYICLEATESSHTLKIDANNPLESFTELFEYQQNHEYQVDKLGEYYYVMTNWQAKNFKLMRAHTSQIQHMTHWHELFSHDPSVLLEDLELFEDFFVLSLREKGQIRINVYCLTAQKAVSNSYTLAFNDSCYLAYVSNNPEVDSNVLRVEYSSLTTPSSCLEIDLYTGERTLLKQQQVLGDFSANNYACERVFVDARDGVQIPASIVYRKSLFSKDGTNPLLQYGYGAYGITIDPSFSSSTLSLLDRGFVFVIAHIRGSEMLGRYWYEQGRQEHKQNTFNDFIDVTKYLVANNYGAANKIFASGGSAGGLLMGAILNQAPQLYLGIGSHVPFVDVLTTMLDATIPLTTNEYDEWGNPNNETQYQTILQYSPLDNIKRMDYPNILVTTGLHDSQVQYFEPMKWVAKLRDYKTDANVLVFKTDMDAGHGGAAGRFKSLQDKALEMAFFITLASDI
jgi:oligopeptidase B